MKLVHTTGGKLRYAAHRLAWEMKLKGYKRINKLEKPIDTSRKCQFCVTSELMGFGECYLHSKSETV